MDRVVSATEARIHFGELMRRAVENHKTIVVECGGKSHVVVISVEE
jgi:prevent-host-death family protein